MSRRVWSIVLVCLWPGLSPAGEIDEQFLEAVRKGDWAGVKSLVAKGVNVNTKFRYDRMALSFACDRGNIEIVKLLLEAGADLNARDSFYQADAMVWAVSKGHVEIIRLLLEKGGRNDEGVLMMGVTGNHPALVRASLDRGGLSAESLTAALARATREDRTEIVGLLKTAGAIPPFVVDVETLGKYVGAYRAENGQELVISQSDGVLKGGLQGQPQQALVALSKEKFRPEAMGGILATFVSEGDKVQSVIVRQGNNETSYKKVGAKP